MKSLKTLLFVCTIAFLITVPNANADVPQLMSYQGFLTDNLGNPLDGSYGMTFSIYTAESSGTLVWTETRTINVNNGAFSVYLGEVAALTDFVFEVGPSDPDRFLGIAVESDPEMARSRISTSPYAYRIATVDSSVSTKLVLDDGTSTRVELGVGSDILKAYDENGWLRVRLSIDSTGARGLDGGGAISFFPAGLFKRGDVIKSAEADSGSLIRLGESAEGAGEISVYDTAGNELARMTSTINDAGAYYTYWQDSTVLTLQGQVGDSGGYFANHGTNGMRSAALSSIVGLPGHGAVGTFDTTGGQRAAMFTDAGADGHLELRNHEGTTSVEMSNKGDSLTAGGGFLQTRGPNGILNAQIHEWFGSPNNALFGLYDHDGDLFAEMGNYGDTVTPQGGYTHIYGPNGNLNCALWYLGGFPNNGYVDVFDATGTSKAGMYVNSSGAGVLYSDLKSSRTTNPSERGTELMFSSLEGPEAGAYIRGTTRLENGKAVIYFPEYFVNVASPEGMTVQVVPLSADSRGLAVIEKHADHIVVQELQNGNGSYEFDYTINAVRKGYENYQVVRTIEDRMPSKPDSKKRQNLDESGKGKKVELVGSQRAANNFPR